MWWWWWWHRWHRWHRRQWWYVHRKFCVKNRSSKLRNGTESHERMYIGRNLLNYNEPRENGSNSDSNIDIKMTTAFNTHDRLLLAKIMYVQPNECMRIEALVNKTTCPHASNTMMYYIRRRQTLEDMRQPWHEARDATWWRSVKWEDKGKSDRERESQRAKEPKSFAGLIFSCLPLTLCSDKSSLYVRTKCMAFERAMATICCIRRTQLVEQDILCRM